MDATQLDPCFLSKKSKKGELDGMISAIVDDALRAGAKDFEKKEEDAAQKFKTVKHKKKLINFAGMNINNDGDALATDCAKHIDKSPLKLSKNATCKDFSGIRRQLSWATRSSRPGIGCIAAKLAQAREQDLDVDQLKLMKKGIKKFKKNKNLCLKHQKLDDGSLQLRTRSDASFATNRDETSQLSRIVALADKRDKGCILHWSGSKCARVARSMLGAELRAFCDAMDF